ncbi:uncharacterized protein LOC143281686 [Babylonia areolata]|uniref:uncharacterized protein LOC143281686 n=1 Tax=Babylonia areolata TaxID=304850 RepID=UPI003FD24711
MQPHQRAPSDGHHGNHHVEGHVDAARTDPTLHSPSPEVTRAGESLTIPHPTLITHTTVNVDSHLHAVDSEHMHHIHHRHHHQHHHHHHHQQHHHQGHHLDPSGVQAQGHGMQDMGHSMKPVFQWVQDVPVLFSNWTTSTVFELAMAMLMAAFLAAVYEWLRNWLSVWDGSTHFLAAMPRWKRMCMRLARSLMHALTAAVSYLQMLFAMTYDLRIFVAIILGSGMGFFVLGPYFRKMRQARKSAKKACAKQKAGYVLGTESEENAGNLIDSDEKGFCETWEHSAEDEGEGEGGGSDLFTPCSVEEEVETVL